jgi:Caspase domain
MRLAIRTTLAAALLYAFFLQPVLAQSNDLDPEQLGFSPDVKRYALIIANDDYDLDGQIHADPADRPTFKHLKDLKNPCSDGKLFRDKLISSKWQTSEIDFPGCNLTASQMRDSIRKFVQKIPSSENTLFILYFSGHGAQLHDGESIHSLIFGVKAQLDLAEVRKARINSPGAISMINDISVDIDDAFRGIGAQDRNAILVILDACRNNLVYDEIKNGDPNFPFASLSSSDLHFPGVVFAYPTTKGLFADDGFGAHSIFTESLASLLASDRRIDDVLNYVGKRVRDRYQKAYPGEGWKLPEIKDRFNARWCVWACRPDSTPNPQNAASHASISLPPYASLVALQLPLLATSTVSTAPPVMLPPTSSVYQSSIPETELTAPGMSIDVFYCTDGPGAEMRAERAARLAGELATDARVDQVTGRSEKQIFDRAAWATIGSVRLRRLSQTSNTAFGFRYSGDVINVDANEKFEAAWAARLLDQYDPKLTQLVNKGRSPGYLSIAICSVPDDPARPPATLYLQVPTKALKRDGAALMVQLQTNISGVRSAEGVEVRNDGPDRTELRYYFPEDRDHVFAVASAIESQLDIQTRIQFLPKLANASLKGFIEIWFGKEEENLSKSLRRAISMKK